MKKRIFVRVALTVWVIIWAVFLVRPYFKKGLLDRYISLAKLSTEGKRGYVTGEELYSFIKFCKESVKEPSTYRIEGLEKDSIEHRRFKYYIYPNIEEKIPEYIFIYKTKYYPQNGYKEFSRMNDENYILRKMN